MPIDVRPRAIVEVVSVSRRGRGLVLGSESTSPNADESKRWVEALHGANLHPVGRVASICAQKMLYQVGPDF